MALMRALQLAKTVITGFIDVGNEFRGHSGHLEGVV